MSIPDESRDNLCSDLPQKSRRYDIANSRYHFRRREFDEAIKLASSSISKEYWRRSTFAAKLVSDFHEFSEIISLFF